MPVDLAALADDLAAETIELERVLVPLDDAGWRRMTPAAGWTVQDQVNHLAFFDEAAATSATDPDRFRSETEVLLTDPDGITEGVARRSRSLTPAESLAWFRSSRIAMLEAFGALDPSTRVPWYGPDMSIASSLTARIMETWAHGQDIYDALGVPHPPTRAVRQVAHIGVRALPNSFRARNRDVPDAPVFVQLRAPDGAEWTWGDPAAADRVRGDAVEFCLVVTQRTNVADTALEVDGPVARAWMQIAQAFAGPPGSGRAPTR